MLGSVVGKKKDWQPSLQSCTAGPEYIQSFYPRKASHVLLIEVASPLMQLES
jgi:hypothetical protein